ncbi:protein rogdi [Halyomorpha halys]|uniref:protein rogdi n=1 Tax=Halyomorpha halys TaxID=286706 RepID=UPI0006D5167F|nr:protein rogdi [Halyomorpha halys]
MMADAEREEALSLQNEFEWVLHKEVHAVLNQLSNILSECLRRFPMSFASDGSQKHEKYVFSGLDQLKCVVSLCGDSITQAEINFRIQRQQAVQYRTCIQSENPWRLHQIQDAVNHLNQAIVYIDNVDKNYNFRSSEEVLHVLGNILGCLQRGRTSLILPRKRTVVDLMKSRNMRNLVPNLPEDLALSFYIQSHKLIVALYQVSNIHGNMKFDSHQAEISVPWLNEVLVLFTVALQLCQQLKDKIGVFAQYRDFTINPPSQPMPCA